MLRKPVFPPLVFRGTPVPDVPEGAALLVVPLYAVSVGIGAPTTFDLRGIDGAVGTWGSLNMYRRRTTWNADTTADVAVRVRPIGLSVWIERSNVLYGGTLGNETYSFVREPLDGAGNWPGDSVDLLRLDGGDTSATPAKRVVFGAPIGGTGIVDPILPPRDGWPLLLSDAYCRFRVQVQDTNAAGLPAGTVMRGTLVVAHWPDRDDFNGDAP